MPTPTSCTCPKEVGTTSCKEVGKPNNFKAPEAGHREHSMCHDSKGKQGASSRPETGYNQAGRYSIHENRCFSRSLVLMGTPGKWGISESAYRATEGGTGRNAKDRILTCIPISITLRKHSLLENR